MREENKACLQFVQEGNIGAPVFFRYSVSINEKNRIERENLLQEIFDWLISFGPLEVERLLATYSDNEHVLLVTIHFQGNILANIFLNFAYKQAGYVKKFEVAGTEGLYSYDSKQSFGFVSDCCTVPEYQVAAPKNEHRYWLNLCKQSLQNKTVVYGEGKK